MAKAGALYEQDFFLWTKEQAAALRAEKLLEHSRLPLAWHDQRTALGLLDPIRIQRSTAH
ncbi:MAG TPA: hypothetical protein VNN75_07105 [Stellaceae bacterium]|nr:hypothetical protein [Stellaceae bacterium]